jgi:DNA-binding NarL/FixJ family response regulator
MWDAVKPLVLSSKHGRRILKNQLFTETEEEIIKCICLEMTNKEIAAKLFLSVRTIEGYRLRILNRLGVKSVIGLVVYAIQNDLFQLEWKLDRARIPIK